jgi:hypothetical protein
MVMVTPFFIATLLLPSGRLGHSQQYKQGSQCMTPLEISMSVRKRVDAKQQRADST